MKSFTIETCGVQVKELNKMSLWLRYSVLLHLQVERTQESERPDSMVSETSSVRDSVGSFKEWEDYNSALQDVLNWLSQAERTLESQENISDDVDAVKKQFHGHEVKKYRNISSLYTFIIRDIWMSSAVRSVFH